MSIQSFFKIDENILPRTILAHDGDVIYYGSMYDRATSDVYLEKLLSTIKGEHEEVFLYGKLITMSRRVAWYGDTGITYSYSGTIKTPRTWTKELLAIKNTVEQLTGDTYNSCLVNIYDDGTQGMGWHTDKESIGDGRSIASVSFGAERRFDFRHTTTKETISVQLEHGSLLVMRGQTQKYWKHQLPKSKKVQSLRINLTFRRI